MSPRPRTVDDSTILAAAVTVLSRMGPERLTLADVGEEAGLSAATLVQRFGSKRELLLSVLKFATGGMHERFESASRGHESPLEALFAAAADRAVPVGEPEALGNLLAFYLAALNDADFRALAIENSNRAVAGYKRLLDEAVAAGEVDSYVDTAQLAQTIYSLTMGTLLTWAVTGGGNYRSRVRRELDVLLRPFRRTPRKAPGHSQFEPPDRPGRKTPPSASPAVTV
ncbi:MAG: TetR/AcrR family transcriptional regulator [Gemmatimonadales bacterium]